jgi:hypothetical protein
VRRVWDVALHFVRMSRMSEGLVTSVCVMSVARRLHFCLRAGSRPAWHATRVRCAHWLR